MYGEAQLGGEWFPARIFELSKDIVQATVISSLKAQEHNIIGIDVSIPKERVQLLDEPATLQSLEKVVPYGNIHKKKRHQRHVSAIPDEETVTGIDPLEKYPGISPNQIEELDRCLAKFIQRATKIDVTWRKSRENTKSRCATYIQECSDGTSRVMTRGLCKSSFELFKKLFDENQPQNAAAYSQSVSAQILKEYGPEMCIKNRTISAPGVFGLHYYRENIFYEWKLQRGETYFVLWSSLEVDDETGLGVLDPDSTSARSIVNPGTGWAFTRQGDDIQYIIMQHINPGGWVPRTTVLENMQDYCEETWTEFCEEVQQKHAATQVQTQMGKSDAAGAMSSLVGSILSKHT